MAQPKYITDVSKLTQIPKPERDALKRVTEKYAFRANDYYLGLIDWSIPMIRYANWLFPTKVN